MDHILFVEQECSERAELAAALQNTGFALTLVPTCERGLALLRGERFDLIILDILLANEKVFDQCRAIHEIVSTPLLLIINSCDEEEIRTAIDAGAADFIPRPVRPEELNARARTILKRATASLALPGWMVQYDDLLLDLRSRRLTRNGISLPLTPTELRLLSYFMHHPGEVLSKSSLLQAVWNYQCEPEDHNLVESAIKRLRSTLEEDPRHPQYITTVWGQGYRFGN